MLADAIVRLQRGKPDRRYAMDPAHHQAIQNYLRLMTRGYGMPQTLRQLSPQINQRLGEVDGPLFHRLMGAMFQGDDSAPGATLDLMHDRDIAVPHHTESMTHGEGDGDELSDFLHLLTTAHHHLTGGLNIPGMFDYGKFHENPVRGFMTNTLRPTGRILQLLSGLSRDVPHNHPAMESLATLNDSMRGREILGTDNLRNAHDTADAFVQAIPRDRSAYTTALHARGMAQSAAQRLHSYLIGQQPLEG
jgi:hypothetical protein